MRTMKDGLWKLYALLFVAIQIWSILESDKNSTEFGFFIWSLAGTLALIGYVFKKPIGARIIWRIYFGLLVLSAAVFLSFVLIGLISNPNIEIMSDIVFIIAVQMPYWFAIWAYAYKSNQIWQKNARQK